MKKLMVLSFLLLLTSLPAQAIPSLFYDGRISYSAASGLLTLDAALVGSNDLTDPALVTGGSLNLSAAFIASASSGSVTTDFFGTAPGMDFTVLGGDGSILLEGEFLSLALKGANGLDVGVLLAEATPTGGSALADFTAPSKLFALQLNMTSVFGASLFDSDFSAQADGRLAAIEGEPPAGVPEPREWALLIFGLLFWCGDWLMRRVRARRQ